MTADTVETRVARGVALLDEKRPGWWAEDCPRPIDLDRLSIVDCKNCICGQLSDDDPTTESSGFTISARELFGDAYDFTPWAKPLLTHGFSGTPDVGGDEFDALTAEWRRVILARRGGAS